MIDGLLTRYRKALDEIKEGEATLDQQKLMFGIIDALAFQTNRYMLFPPVPLTTEDG